MQHGQNCSKRNLKQGHFSYILWHTFSFFYFPSDSFILYVLLKEANNFLSSPYFIPQHFFILAHLWTFEAKFESIIAYLDKYNQFFHHNNSSAGKIVSRTSISSSCSQRIISTYLCGSFLQALVDNENVLWFESLADVYDEMSVRKLCYNVIWMTKIKLLASILFHFSISSFISISIQKNFLM